MKDRILVVVSVLIVFVLLQNTAAACPTCKLAIEGGPGHADQGFAYSIMFMITMPFLIALGWGIFIWRTISFRRDQSELTLEISSD